MEKVTIDASLLAQLYNLNSALEFRDSAGRVLGYFHPSTTSSAEASGHSPFSREEIERRRDHRMGRPLSEILTRLCGTVGEATA
jgi:hypothetical protein